MRCDLGKGTGRFGAKGLGLLFLISMVLHVAASALINVLESRGFVFPTEVMLIISELTMLVPSVVYILIKNLSFRDDLGFRPVRAGTFFMCILLAVLVTPVASLANVLSQLFVSNHMVQASDELLGASGVALIVLGALYGPFCEEFLFRSVFFNGYEKITGPMRAAFISAFLFALAHMNFNQAAYAFVLGFIFAVVNKAAGSVYPSLIIHVCINGWNLIALLVTSAVSEMLGEEADLASAAEAARQSDFLYYMIGVSLVAAIICTAISIPCIVWVSKHEGRFNDLYDMFAVRHARGRWITIPMALAICFVLLLMIGTMPVISYFKGE